jgi:hypothetical protein
MRNRFLDERTARDIDILVAKILRGQAQDLQVVIGSHGKGFANQHRSLAVAHHVGMFPFGNSS